MSNNEGFYGNSSFSEQELKLNTLLLEELEQLSGLLFLLACDLRKHNYKDYYQRDFPKLFTCVEEYSQLTEGIISVIFLCSGHQNNPH